MDQMRITGGTPLQGKITISGAKNAALPLLTASLLTDEGLILSNVPKLADIATMGNLLSQHGTQINLDGQASAASTVGCTMELKAQNITNTTAPYDLVRKMRASILVLGPLLARCREAKVSLPGGCAIGTRPVDFHINALRAMGAEIVIEGGYIVAKAPGGLQGAEIDFPTVTVTGTENILMAAALAKGETVILNAAREPEVVDLANCLVAMGAEIEGIGTDKITVRGKDRLHGASHRVIPDRIETGSFMMAVGVTGGAVELVGADTTHLQTPCRRLREAGIEIEKTESGLMVRRLGERVKGTDVMTEPFPGFPTDLQAQMMALMCTAEGAAMMTETIFENRFMHVPELARMGADITVHNASALIRGKARLKGAPVMATDLRASMSLVIAGLMAEGETILSRIYHLDRGYERLEEKLGACGAKIERVRGIKEAA